MLTTWREQGSRTQRAFTGRQGGVSSAPFDALNLGDHVGDSLADVTANRTALAAELGLDPTRLLFLEQVHGTEVAVADQPWSTPPRADGAVTATPGLHLVAMVADCVPVVLTDDAAGVAGVAHAGRKGLAAGVVPAVIEAMTRLGARAITAVVGPSICGRCYEVPAEMRDEVAALVPGTATQTRDGTPGLDLSAGVIGQLSAAGVPARLVDGCTAETPGLFSYRRDQRTGRFAGIAGVLG